MKNTTTETKRIDALTPRPPEHTEVAVPVTQPVIQEASNFVDEYLSEGNRTEFMTRDELVLLAGVFITAAQYLGLRTFHMMHWLHRSGRYDPELMREYAEHNLGMECLDTPVSASRRRRAA